MPSSFTAGQMAAIANGEDKGLRGYFAYFDTPSEPLGTLYADRFLAHLRDLCGLLEQRTRESASLCSMPLPEAHLLNYTIFGLHLLRYIQHRNRAGHVDAERALVNRVIDLFAERLAIQQIPESELTTLLEIMRDDWLAADRPRDITMFLVERSDRYAPDSCVPLLALSGGDVEGLLMTQIVESTAY